MNTIFVCLVLIGNPTYDWANEQCFSVKTEQSQHAYCQVAPAFAKLGRKPRHVSWCSLKPRLV